MVVLTVDGKQFIGPKIIGKDVFPDVPAIALICTEAGEGLKIMSVIQGDNIAKAIAESPKMDCWVSHANHGQVDVYILETDMSPGDREKFRIEAIRKRDKFMFCEEMPKIEDDW